MRRLLAEVNGSALLTLFGAGAVVAAFYHFGELTYAGFGFVGLSFAVAIAVAVHAFGPVSGAHINPTVTFALAAAGRFQWREVVPYILAQLLGGVLAGENMGIVEEVGDGVAKLQPGDRISLPFNVACGFRKNCEAGNTAFCLTVNFGFGGGAFDPVEYITDQMPPARSGPWASPCRPTRERPRTGPRREGRA